MAKTTKNETISVELMKREVVTIHVVGESPLIMNRLAEKARHELLLPRKKTKAEKESSLKHTPIDEYRSSPHCITDPESPTLLAMPSTAFKGALRQVAVDLPGATSKAKLGRLTYIPGEMVSVWGIPELLMSVVRSADMNRTPDIRTRAILPNWAASFEISYVTPALTSQVVSNLMANAGEIVGVGDWRPEKGAGAYGRFRICDAKDPEYKAIVKSGARAAQQQAIETPSFYNDETRELFDWWGDEVERRGRTKTDKKEVA